MTTYGSSQPDRIFHFGSFELSEREGELRKNGVRIKLQEHPFRVLLELVSNRGRLVTREELQQKLWSADTFVDFDVGVNTAIRKLRQALGDEADNPRFIETLSRRGYRFIGPVDGGSVAATRIEIGVAPKRAKSSLTRRWIAIACVAIAVLVVLVWAGSRNSKTQTGVLERQLTANSQENSVTSMAISPDGKQLAFAENTGLFLKLVRTGEVYRVPLPPEFKAGVDDWFPDGYHLLVSRAEGPGKSSLWSISPFGGTPRQLAENASLGSLSPDGTHIAFLRGDAPYSGLWGQEEWVMRADGTDQVKVSAARQDDSQVGVPTWSPDGSRIAYIRSTWVYDARASAVEINQWQKASAQTLFSDSRLSPAVHWLPDGRLIYAFGSTPNQQDSILWAASLSQSTKISSSPKRITGGHGWISQIAGSADGRVVIFLRGNWLPSVYLGTLDTDGTKLLATRRLTLDENENIPVAWTPDSKAILFSSNRNGTREIFKQAIDEPLAERLVTGADHLSQPRITPDGSEILYVSTPRSAGPESPSAILAVPIGGGPPRLVLKDVGIAIVECARLPSTICMYTTVKGSTWETFRFDVRSGKSPSAPQIDPNCNWSLSPDGSERAIIEYRPNQGTIQFRSTTTGKTRELVVKGWNGLIGVGWSADGRSLLVSWHDFERDSALLNVTLDGKASVLLRSSNPEIWHAIPSPNGKLLAIAEAGGAKNVWQVEGF